MRTVHIRICIIIILSREPIKKRNGGRKKNGRLGITIRFIVVGLVDYFSWEMNGEMSSIAALAC